MGKAVGIVHISATPSNPTPTSALIEALQEQVGKRLAMHVVASKPQYLTPTQVPQDVVDKEEGIFREQLKDEKKKESVIEGIIKGKLRKHLSEICLLDQVHVAEEGGPVVSKHLDAVKTKLGLAKLQVKGFVLWNLSK
ncbi:hypothetical protein EON65_19690 [archaeon]|nr:MAG: hypothetical protein EON65_19690 [archaeon]